MTIAVAPVAVMRLILVENEQPVPSVLSKSNNASLPSKAAALVMVQDDGLFEKVAFTISAVMSNVCGPDIEMPILGLATIDSGA
jgi:hypothetical protein